MSRDSAAGLRIPLSSPDITEREIRAVSEVLATPQLSLGPRLGEFERAVAAYAGSRHAVAVSSGTAGLHLCVRLLGLRPGDEVLTTPFSFVASANVLLYEGVRPQFVDIDAATLNIDPQRLETAITPRTRAILVVHVFGRPAPMHAVLDVARRHRLYVIEDACEAIGGEYEDRKLGTLGQLGVYAFYPNKQITTGEGGVLVTDDPVWARRAAALRNQGRDPDDPGLHSELGYNYRLSEMQCAMGLAQLERIESILEQRADVARRYHRRLAGREELVLPDPSCRRGGGGGRISWFVYVVRLSEEYSAADRDRIAAGLVARGIGCGRYFPPIHLQPVYRERFGHAEGDYPIAERVAARTLALPFFNALSDAEIDEVCGNLLELCRR